MTSPLSSNTTELSHKELRQTLRPILPQLKSKSKEKHPFCNKRRPQLGSASCGLFGISDDFSEERLSLDELLIDDREATFYFKAQGNSMAPFIEEGDILIVDASLTPKSGQIIIAYFEGGRLCKRLIYRGPRGSLHSDNPHYSPLPICEESEFQVFGVVTGIIRRPLL